MLAFLKGEDSALEGKRKDFRARLARMANGPDEELREQASRVLQLEKDLPQSTDKVPPLDGKAEQLREVTPHQGSK